MNELNLNLTPREEFEQQFGAIDDEKWEWLKEFLVRNDTRDKLPWNRIVGFRIDDRVYHPSEVQVILKK